MPTTNTQSYTNVHEVPCDEGILVSMSGGRSGSCQESILRSPGLSRTVFMGHDSPGRCYPTAPVSKAL